MFPISTDHAVYCNVSVLHNAYIKTDLELNGVSISAILRSVYAIQYSVSEGGVMATFTSEPDTCPA